jgi:hypothetical protein
MSTPVRSLVITAVAVGIVGWLWWRDDAATMPEPAPPQQANERILVTPAAVSSTEAIDDGTADLPRSPAVATDDGIAALVRGTADRTYDRLGPQFVEHLVSKGLSRDDSERLVADMMPDWVRCQLDATLAQADEQSLSRADVLAVLDANGVFAVPAQLDARAAIARAQPCRFNVQQRIGIAPGDFGLRPMGSSELPISL